MRKIYMMALTALLMVSIVLGSSGVVDAKSSKDSKSSKSSYQEKKKDPKKESKKDTSQTTSNISYNCSNMMTYAEASATGDFLFYYQQLNACNSANSTSEPIYIEVGGNLIPTCQPGYGAVYENDSQFLTGGTFVKCVKL